MHDLENMCGYCWKRGVAKVTRRRNTFWRTLFALPRPSRWVCRDHFQRAAEDMR